MKRSEFDLIAEQYTKLYNEQYQLGSDYVEFVGDYEDDVMFYKDFQEGEFANWLENERPITTKYVAMGQDLVEMGVHADANSVYLFNNSTDFTHTALIAESRV
tara:strand:- start:645 stop:953 length:309 start_codon:yes stop_codon:yes gene_type:complete